MNAKDVKELYEAIKTRHTKLWEFWLKCYDFALGRQWSQNEVAHHKKWDIVTRTYNFILAQVITIEGLLRDNQFKVKAYGRNREDYDKADRITRIYEYLFREAKTQENIIRTFIDGWITGVGAISAEWVQSEYYPDGTLDTPRISIFDCLFDLDSSSADHSQDRFRGITRWGDYTYWQTAYGLYDPDISREIEARARTAISPDVVEKQKRGFFTALKDTISSSRRIANELHRRSRGEMKADDYYDPASHMVRGFQIDYVVYPRRLCILDPIRCRIHPIPDEYKEDNTYIQQVLRDLGLIGKDNQPLTNLVEEREVREYRRCVAIPHLFPDELLFDAPLSVQGMGYPIKLFIPYDYDFRRHEMVSGVSITIDNQQRVNRAMVYQEEIIKRYLFPDWLVEKGAITDKEDWQTWKVPALSRLLQFNRGFNPPHRIEPSPALGAMLTQDLSVNIDLAPKLNLIAPQLVGQKHARKDGAELFQMMSESAQVPIKGFIAKAQQTLVELARHSIALAQKHMWAKRWIQVLGPDGGVDVNKSFYVNDYDLINNKPVNDMSTTFYDFVLDATQYSPLERQNKFLERINAMAVMDPLIAQFTFPQLIELSGWPDTERYLRAWEIAIRVKFAPYGDQILEWLKDESKMRQAMANGEITPELLEQIRTLSQMGQQGIDRAALETMTARPGEGQPPQPGQQTPTTSGQPPAQGIQPAMNPGIIDNKAYRRLKDKPAERGINL